MLIIGGIMVSNTIRPPCIIVIAIRLPIDDHNGELIRSIATTCNLHPSHLLPLVKGALHSHQKSPHRLWQIPLFSHPLARSQGGSSCMPKEDSTFGTSFGLSENKILPALVQN